jgi:hypothetical protein
MAAFSEVRILSLHQKPIIMSDVNYPEVIAIIVAALLFVGWLTWRNLKDKKKFEEDASQAEIAPEKHDKDETRL